MSLAYREFLSLGYTPKESDVIAVYYVEPAEGVSIEDAACRVAAEGSVGTWTTLTLVPERVHRIKGRVFEIDGNIVKVAYDLDLFDLGDPESGVPPNLPQFLSCVAGNIFGMGALKNLRLLDIHLPREFVERFRGPQFGIDGVRRILKVEKRPLLATVPKPKVGFSAEEFARCAYEIWVGGVDFVKDDENLTSLKFNKFEERVRLLMKMREKAEDETGERKAALINVTAETREMLRRAKLVHDYGGEFVMIDFVVAGWAALQTLREECEDLHLAIHAHRAMHAAFTRNPRHGISMLVLAKLARLVGVDHIHVGTAGLGKMHSEARETLEICNFLRSEWYGKKKVFPVASGGLHPGVLPGVISAMGSDILIQVGGGVFGHPDGVRAGAKAVREAVEAVIEGTPLKERAKSCPELARALEKWGTQRAL